MAEIPEALRELPLIVDIGGAAFVILGGAWAGVRYVWPVMQATGKAISGLMELGRKSEQMSSSLSRVESIEQSIAAIRHEVLPNGGYSLRDAVSRTETTVALIVARQRARDDSEDEIVRLDCDERGAVTWVSQTLVRWTERSLDELKSNGWMSFIHPEDREDVAEEWSRCIKYTRSFDSAFRLINRSGHTTAVRMSAVPVMIRTGNDSVPHWSATMRRIDEIPDSLIPPERSSE